jgi:S1-C subfamily serine protease
MQDGDVIVRMGEYEISDIYDYMESLSGFEKGDRVTVVVQRDGEQIPLNIQF